MFIPNQMRKTIAKTFYDKTVSILNKKIETDSEGGVTSKGYEEIASFNCNVSFSNCGEIQEEYGLDYNINISITTDYKEVKIDDIIKYQDIIYKVSDVIPSDSHYLIVGVKWRQ